jgi:hypothetical protein
MKKGCLIVAGLVAVLFVAGFAFLWRLADQYEDRPKEPGEAELWEAEQFVLAFEDAEAKGNSSEATEFAENFARSFRAVRHLYFTEGKPGARSFTKGRFLTYCFLTEDSLALIIHVPELRRYADDAKLTLSELAWRQATSAAVLEHPSVSKLAIGLKGSLNYSAIMTGIVDAEAPMDGLEQRHPVTSQKPLWPYFIPDTASNQNGEQGGAEESAIRSMRVGQPRSSLCRK